MAELTNAVLKAQQLAKETGVSLESAMAALDKLRIARKMTVPNFLKQKLHQLQECMEAVIASIDAAEAGGGTGAAGAEAAGSGSSAAVAGGNYAVAAGGIAVAADGGCSAGEATDPR